MNKGVIYFETGEHRNNWSVALEVPREFIPESLRDKDQFKYGWIFQEFHSMSRKGMTRKEEWVLAFRKIAETEFRKNQELTENPDFE